MKELLIATSLASLLATSSFAGAGGDIFRTSLNVDQLEYQDSKEKAITWDAFMFAGYDINKVYLYSEGEKPRDEKVSSETQLLYSRAITPYWDIQTGLEYDKTPENSKTWGVIGFQGLAPYFFETKTSLLFSNDGNIGLKMDAEYEALITQKLILSPSIGLTAYTKNDAEMEIGKGLSNLTVGTRLRYEVKREFAPYIGVEWSKNFGKTANYASLDEAYFTVGLKFWF
jgi:copper resistance protein B